MILPEALSNKICLSFRKEPGLLNCRAGSFFEVDMARIAAKILAVFVYLLCSIYVLIRFDAGFMPILGALILLVFAPTFIRFLRS